MAPYKKKSYRRGSRDKYSVEQSVFDASLSAATTTVIDVVPPTTLQGMRKVKHLAVNCLVSTEQTVAAGIIWALMYIPQGMTVPAFNVTSGSPLIEPNQFVLNCGVFDNNAGPTRLTTRLSRNLNSGDRIVLLMQPAGGSGGATVAGVVRYAITLQ